MPQQLIYTSSPRGLTPGRSGYCTVARSSTMREALASRLEQLSYYQHLSLAGGQERPVCAYRVVDIRGTRFHVLSRLLDAGLDYTNRTNFLAHHLVLTPEEASQLPCPPLLFLHWDGWRKAWEGDPRMLDSENWGNLAKLDSASTVPAQTWTRLTGHGVNGLGLLDLQGSAWLQTDGLTEDDVLALLAESLSLLAFRERRSVPSLTTWQVTFTTAHQEQDSPNDFRWRCFNSGPSSVRAGGGQQVIPLLEIRPRQQTEEEQWFAERGPAPASILQRPHDTEAREGEAATFQVEARGIPYPTYEWFLDGVPIIGQNGAQCVISRVEAANGQARQFRVMVRVANGYGRVEATARLVVQPKIRIASASATSSAPAARRKVVPGASGSRPRPESSIPSSDQDPSDDAVSMLVQRILEAREAGTPLAAEPSLQEIRRQQRQAELDSLPDGVLKEFLKQSQKAGHPELVRIIESALARRPKQIPKFLVGLCWGGAIAGIVVGAVMGANWWKSRHVKSVEDGQIAQKGTNASRSLPFTEQATNKVDSKTPKAEEKRPTLQPSPVPAMPAKQDKPGRALSLPKGTSYFLLFSTKNSLVPPILKPIFDRLLPTNATNFAATNLQFGVVDLNRWQDLQSAEMWATNRAKLDHLEFWNTNETWKASFKRTSNGIIWQSEGQFDGGKVVFGRNGESRNETVFRLVFVPGTASSLPFRNAKWEADRLKFDGDTVNQLETLFGERDRSQPLRLNVSFGRGKLLSLTSTTTNLNFGQGHQILVSDFIETQKKRIESEKAAWAALTKLVEQVKDQGDALKLEGAFRKLQDVPLGKKAKEPLKECLALLLVKLVPSIAAGEDWTVTVLSDEHLKQVKPPKLQRDLRLFFGEPRKHLIEFLTEPVSDAQGKQIASPAQDAWNALDATLDTLDKMKKRPVDFLEGKLEISINSSFHPVVNLDFKTQ